MQYAPFFSQNLINSVGCVSYVIKIFYPIFFRACFWIHYEQVCRYMYYVLYMSCMGIDFTYSIKNTDSCLITMYLNIYPSFLASKEFLSVYLPQCTSNQPPVESLHGQCLFNNFAVQKHLSHVRLPSLIVCRKIYR